MTKHFGLPYMGSKSGIAEWVISKLPPADTFVDLFAGGCAVTQAAILSGKYKRIISNDITDSALIFRDAINGRFHDENRWISHDEFEANAKNDPYIRFCFSFGYNIKKGYLYSREIEPYKRALHYAVAFQSVTPLAKLGIEIPRHIVNSKDIRKNRLAMRKYILSIFLKKRRLPVSRKIASRLLSIEHIQSLERIQDLEHLKKNKKIVEWKPMQGSYDEVRLPSGNSVIYCDPPYRGTEGYGREFNFNAFDEFCRSHKDNIFISEYLMPKDFKRMTSLNKRVTLSISNKGEAIESIWIHEDMYNNLSNTK